jgi:very-short-patch-repair endonuclease
MGSPIEEMLLDAILEHNEPSLMIGYEDGSYGPGDAFSVLAFLERQARVGSYRTDFLVTFDGESKFCLCIECDGHDWHERTKQQAAYDRSRDRELLAQGVLTVRFTGSEITHSANRCASDVIRAIMLVHEISNLIIEGWQIGHRVGLESAAERAIAPLRPL